MTYKQHIAAATQEATTIAVGLSSSYSYFAVAAVAVQVGSLAEVDYSVAITAVALS